MSGKTLKLNITVPAIANPQGLINDIESESSSLKSESQTLSYSKEDSEQETSCGLVCINCQSSYKDLREMYCEKCYNQIFTPDKGFIIEIEANSNTINSELGIISDSKPSTTDRDIKMFKSPGLNQSEGSTVDLELNPKKENSAPSDRKIFKNITEKTNLNSAHQKSGNGSLQPRRNPTRNAALKRKADSVVKTTIQQKKVKSAQDQEGLETNCSNNDDKATPTKIKVEPSPKSNNDIVAYPKSMPSARTKDSESPSSITTENASENLKDIEVISTYSEVSNRENAKKKSKVTLLSIEESQASEDDENNEKGFFFFNEDYDICIECFSEEDDFIDIYEVRDKKEEFECWPRNSDIPLYLDSIICPKPGQIKVGKPFQSYIPKFRKKNLLRSKPKMKWDPERLSSEIFDDYSERFLKMAKVNMDKLIEQRAIEILVENEYDVEKALEFVKSNLNMVRNRVTFKNRKCVI